MRKFVFSGLLSKSVSRYVFSSLCRQCHVLQRLQRRPSTSSTSSTLHHTITLGVHYNCNGWSTSSRCFSTEGDKALDCTQSDVPLETILRPKFKRMIESAVCVNAAAGCLSYSHIVRNSTDTQDSTQHSHQLNDSSFRLQHLAIVPIEEKNKHRLPLYKLLVQTKCAINSLPESSAHVLLTPNRPRPHNLSASDTAILMQQAQMDGMVQALLIERANKVGVPLIHMKQTDVQQILNLKNQDKCSRLEIKNHTKEFLTGAHPSHQFPGDVEELLLHLTVEGKVCNSLDVQSIGHQHMMSETFFGTLALMKLLLMT